MDHAIKHIYTVLCGFPFHPDSPAGSWFRVNQDLIQGHWTAEQSGPGPYQRVQRPEYEPVATELREWNDDLDVSQALTILGLPVPRATLVGGQLAGLMVKHEGRFLRYSEDKTVVRYQKYQPQAPTVQPQAVRCLMPGDEFHLIDLLTGAAVLPEGVKDFERMSMLRTWVGFEDLSDQGNFKAIRDRECVYRIAPPKLKPLPSEVSNLLVEVPELKTRLIELGYDLRQPVRT